MFKSGTILRAAAFGLLLVLIGAVMPVSAQEPPVVKELKAAFRLQDTAARIKELERIKAAYPSTEYMSLIEQNILVGKVELAGTLEDVLALQEDALAKAKEDRVQALFIAADGILNHPKVKTFDAAKVLTAVLAYREAAVKALESPDAFQGIPAESHADFKAYFLNGFKLFVAAARLGAGDAGQAKADLDAYIKDGGATDAGYFYLRGGVNEKTGKTREAYEAYLGAAAERYRDATDKAKEIFLKLNGKADGFEAALDAKRLELPYLPEPFKAPADWKGRTVLAEVFTGSECPPCVGADLGFDGLIEAYPAKYLAVLEYHLPIPGPDPMINAATQQRQEYYGVNSTPSTFFDGEAKLGGGGSRGMAGGKFKAYKAEIDPRIAAAPALLLETKAVRAGDVIKVECRPDKAAAAAGADIFVALVQGVEKFSGGNGIVFHKMIVRDLAVLPAAGGSASFDLAASEAAADAYLTKFEQTSTRFKGYKFAERHAKIDRQGLRIVAWAQAKDTKKVLNTAVVEVN